jgi:DNA-binding IclR family transcriptional regulator
MEKLDHRARRPSASRSHKPAYAVPALDRGLDVLEALANNPVPQSLSSLARLVKQTPSSVFRLLSRLEHRMYVTRDSESGLYSLSLRLFELSHTHSPVERLIRVAGKSMRSLAESVNESVHLSVLNNHRLIVLLDVGSPTRVRFSHEVGAQFSPVTANSGRLLLAYLSPEDLEEHLGRNAEYAGFNKVEKASFHEELKQIRRNRYAVSSSEERAGMKDLAVLVGNPVVGITAALAIACLTGGKNAGDINRLISALQTCAKEISNALALTYD